MCAEADEAVRTCRRQASRLRFDAAAEAWQCLHGRMIFVPQLRAVLAHYLHRAKVAERQTMQSAPRARMIYSSESVLLCIARASAASDAAAMMQRKEFMSAAAQRRARRLTFCRRDDVLCWRGVDARGVMQPLSDWSLCANTLHLFELHAISR